jgi:hypothetical protein
MKRKNCLIHLFIVALVLLPVIAHAELQTIQKAQPVQKTPQKLQPAQAVKAEIKSVSTRSLKLEPGGKTAAFTLQGNNLNKITDYRVLLGNHPVQDIEVTLGPSSTKTRRVTLKAKATAKAEEHYTLQLLAGKEIIEVPMTVEVVSPTVAQTPATPLGSPPEQPQPIPAPLPGENQPEPQNNPTEPAHPAYQTTPVHGMEVEHAEEEPLIPTQIYDFQITEVYYYGLHNRVIINFTSGTPGGSVYNGPLSCDVRIGGDSVQRINTSRAATMQFVVPYNWPESPLKPCYVPIVVTINPDGAVPELNRDNNLYEGKIFETTVGNIRIAYTGNPPQKHIRFLWGHDWGCRSNRNLRESEVREDPGYDPYDRFLYASAGVWVENCAASAGEALVEFIYIAYDKERRDQFRVTLQPGESKYVQTGTPLKIRKKGNYLKVLVSPGYPYRDECRIDLDFVDLPWDWQ